MAPVIVLERVKLHISNLVFRLMMMSTSIYMTDCHSKGHVTSFNFGR